MKTYAVLAAAILSQAAGNVFLSKGMRSIASVAEIGGGKLPVTLLHVAGSPSIWAGTALLILFFALFVTALSWEDLSFVLPVLSLEVVVNVAFAVHFLNEQVSVKRWIGTLLITVGVVLIGRTRTGRGGEEGGRECAEGGECG